MKKFFTLKRISLALLLGLSLAALAVGISTYSVFSQYDKTFTGNAECGVIFGAAVWRDDIPSHALDDRIKAGAKLFNNGNVSCLIVSGGPSKMGSHEVDVMKNELIKKGVQEQSIYTDYDGYRTQETIKNLPKEVTSFVMISQDFHLARIKLLAKKHNIPNVSVHAAPYTHGRFLKEPYFLSREIGGWLIYQFYFPSSPIDLPWF